MLIFKHVIDLTERLLLSILAVFGMFAVCGPASASNSASNLSGYCSTLIEELDKGVAPLSYRSVVCVTYFQGVGDALIKQGGANPTNRCMSDHYLNLDDLRHPKIFQDYLNKHPARRDDVASDVIRDSLEEACSK